MTFKILKVNHYQQLTKVLPTKLTIRPNCWNLCMFGFIDKKLQSLKNSVILICINHEYAFLFFLHFINVHIAYTEKGKYIKKTIN